MRIFDINKSIFWISKIILVVFYVVSLLFNALYVSIPYEKKKPRGTDHFVANGLHVGNGLGCPLEFCRVNKAVHYFHILKQWTAQ